VVLAAGGGESPPAARAEELIGLETTGRSPDTEYHRQWADQVLRRALTRLSEDYAADSKARLYEQLRGQVWGVAEASGGDLAAELGLTEGALRSVASAQTATG